MCFILPVHVIFYPLGGGAGHGKYSTFGLTSRPAPCAGGRLIRTSCSTLNPKRHKDAQDNTCGACACVAAGRNGGAEETRPPAWLIEAIARQESSMNPLAVNVAGKDYYPATRQEVEAIIAAAQASGKSFDMELMQINRWWMSGTTSCPRPCSTRR